MSPRLTEQSTINLPQVHQESLKFKTALAFTESFTMATIKLAADMFAKSNVDNSMVKVTNTTIGMTTNRSTVSAVKQTVDTATNTSAELFDKKTADYSVSNQWMESQWNMPMVIGSKFTRLFAKFVQKMLELIVLSIHLLIFVID